MKHSLKHKLQIWALIVGVTLWGPATMGWLLSYILAGELPTRHSVLLAANHPYIFYAAAIVLLIIAAKFTQISFVAARHLYRRSKR